MKLITSTALALACGAAIASAGPAISESDEISAREPAPGVTSVDGISLEEREPLFFGAALKVGLKMGARLYSNWRSRRKRDLEDVEERDLDDELDARDGELDVFIDMIERSLADEGLGWADVDARDVSDELEDVLERELDTFEALEDMD